MTIVAEADDDLRQVHLTLDLCLRVGELLLSNGAGAADVTATMRLLADHFGLRRAEVDVTFTSLSMSYQREAGDPPAVIMRQVKLREIDYEDLTRVDHLVRDVVQGRVSLLDARAQMARIVSSGHHRKRWAVTLGWGVMCAAVSFFLGGGPAVAAIALVTACCIDRMQLAMSRRRLPFFYQQVAGGALATSFAVASTYLELDLDPSLVVTSNVIMLLAGIGFMGGLQDALSGFYVTAGARLTESLLATAGIIAGVSGGLGIGDLLDAGISRLEPGSAGLETVPVVMAGSAVCAAAFAFSTYAPKRSLLPIAGIGGIATAFSQLVVTAQLGRTWGAGLAAFFIGLVAFAVAGRFKIPPLVVVVPAIVPMLPGLSIYRGLSLLSSPLPGSTSEGLLALVSAAATALALASGVILGEYVAQPLKREARRLESRLAGPRLVGPLRSKVKRTRRPVT
ncbi:MAG TPA: threonine/serine exporter family protein [Marmoricola sp.]|jgi:uncharacterized membrane protein YjjP (DUF1212 family)|nr:threonine/serine exporter family protein [Marmoricola sp.]